MVKQIGAITHRRIRSSYRRRLLDHLSDGPSTVSVAGKAVGLRLPHASAELKRMREEGLVNQPFAQKITKFYFNKIIASTIDTLILGCTHYPLMIKTIKKTIQKDIKIIDSSKITAKHIKQHYFLEPLLVQQKRCLCGRNAARVQQKHNACAAEAALVWHKSNACAAETLPV